MLCVLCRDAGQPDLSVKDIASNSACGVAVAIVIDGSYQRLIKIILIFS